MLSVLSFSLPHSSPKFLLLDVYFNDYLYSSLATCYIQLNESYSLSSHSYQFHSPRANQEGLVYTETKDSQMSVAQH